MSDTEAGMSKTPRTDKHIANLEFNLGDGPPNISGAAIDVCVRHALVGFARTLERELVTTKAALSAAEQRVAEVQLIADAAVPLTYELQEKLEVAEQRAENLRIGQEMFRQQTIRIRRAALGVSDEAIDAAPDIDTEEIVRDLQQRAEAMGRKARNYDWLLHSANKEEIDATLLSGDPWHHIDAQISALASSAGNSTEHGR